MNLSKFSVKRPVATLMLILIIILLGFVSFTNIQTDLFPSINLPIAAVSIRYTGASPEEVENIVTKNVENSLATVSNVDEISSTSSEGSALIIIEFNQGTDMDAAMLEMNESLDLIMNYLPDDVSNPLIIQFDPNMLPIMSYSITMEGKDMWEATNWMDDVFSTRIESVEGVANVNVSGGIIKEIQITPDMKKMSDLGITSQMLSQILMANNVNLPGGSVSEDTIDYSVRTLGSITSISQIKEVTFVSPTLHIPVTLADFATVDFVNTNTKSYNKVNGIDALTISIQKQSGYNTTEVAHKVEDEIANILEDYPEVTVSTIFDQSDYIDQMVGNVSLSALIGAVLAVLILFIFLKDIRPTFIVGIAIPISVVATFVLLYFSNITLNVVSMGGLALGIGMFVDNSIVVLENIYRLRSEGMSKKKAAIIGSKNITGAIVASTLTTISVFLPVVFLQGMTADIFKDMALTIAFSLSTSLLIALTFVPMLSSKILKKDTSTHHKFLDRMKKGYTRILTWSLRRRFVVLLLAFLIFAGSVYGVMDMGTEYFPATDEGQISISVLMEKGTSYTNTVSEVQLIENTLSGYDDIDIINATVGNSNFFMNFGSSSFDSGSITINLVSSEERDMTTLEFADMLRFDLQSLTHAKIIVDVVEQNGMAMMTGSGVSVEILGPDLYTLEMIANDIKNQALTISGVQDAKTSLEKGSPELVVLPDNQKVAMNGLTTYQIAKQVSTVIQGSRLSSVIINNEDITLRLMNPEEITRETLGDIEFTTPYGSIVTLSDLAEIREQVGYTSISRKSQTRLLNVFTTIEEGFDTGTIGDDMNVIIDNYDIPEGYQINLSGEAKETTDAFKDLLFAMIIGIVLVYMIMAAQFESLKHPFIILFAVPLAFTGAFLALLIVGSPLSVPAFLGMIMLTGIVVNNGIILVDYINRLRREGNTVKRAILIAGPIRLRPILMTSTTTILALIPLSLGIAEGTEMLIPLAVSVIGGLLFSTTLTLIIIPVLYSLFNKDKKKSVKRKKK
ncbi:MAG: efflux RND transporter permease subunit [Clostridiales bacterium]|nr:efflux RND transporter permease subunit [Clostridiales bacterium]